MNIRQNLWLLACLTLALAASTSLAAGAKFSVSLAPTTGVAEASGRIIICIAAADAKIPPGTPVLDAPFWDDPQPIFGREVKNLKAGATPMALEALDCSNIAPEQLKPGKYRAAARLITTRLSSSWRDDPGNLFSDEITFEISADTTANAALVLSHTTKARDWDVKSGAELVELRSELLSTFHGRDVMLRAGVVKPLEFDPAKKYACVYEVPGFGGDHFGAIEKAESLAKADASSAQGQLARAAFHIVLDPESPNGHTLFADSDNNGPCGEALVKELIPAIEAKYPSLIAKPEARLLRGHSSGGWSVLWLALRHPSTFGKAWSSSPDPIDFRRFQKIDIYAAENMFGTGNKDAKIIPWNPDPAHWTPTPSFRRAGKVVMLVRDENAGERVSGPNQTSGQQWASWQAVFGPRVGEEGWGKGHPAALFDATSGRMFPFVAQWFKRYDLAELTRTKPETYAPIWRDNIRLVVGDEDSFYLNEAVKIASPDIAAAIKSLGGSDEEIRSSWGRIRVLKGYDHGSIFGSPEIKAFPDEMLQHVRSLK